MPLSLGIGLGLTDINNSLSVSSIEDAFRFAPGMDITNLDRTTTYGNNSMPMLWQDILGLQVTANTNPVGLILEKSQRIDLGSEIITNGTFTDATDWTQSAGTGWGIGSGIATHTANAGPSSDLDQAHAGVMHQTYRLIWDHTRSSAAGSITPRFGINATGATTTLVPSTRFMIPTASNPSVFRMSGTNVTTATADNITLKHVMGYHASQTTAASKPIYTESGAARFLRFDGVDDNLGCSLFPSPGITILAGASADISDTIIGAMDAASGRCTLGTNSTGRVSAGVGDQDPEVILGGSPINGTRGVYGLSFNGATVRLFWNGTKIYEAAQVGVPTSTIRFRIGSNNIAGTAGGPFLNGDLYSLLAVQASLTDAQIATLSALMPV